MTRRDAARAARRWGALPEGMPRARARRAWPRAAGIGFTVSLFIADLAFDDPNGSSNEAKVGIFAGSLLAGRAGLGGTVARRVER